MRRAYPMLAILALLCFSSISRATDYSCQGAFPNPITDICWSCVFPLKLAGATLMSMGQDDIDTGANNMMCSCLGKGGGTIVGITSSFWEVIDLVDVTTKPGCIVGLGGIQMDFDNLPAGTPGVITQTDSGNKPRSFYHTHRISFPVMYVAELLLDNSCLTQTPIDLTYFSEIDPTHADNTLAILLSPDSFLYGNIVAVAACSAWNVACTSFATDVDKAICKRLHWCEDVYPLVGDIPYHFGMVASAQIMVHREIVKAGRELRTWGAAGSDGMCSYYPDLMPDITTFKMAMMYPVPQTEKILGKCCEPIGRSSVLWGSGKEFPVKGEDFSFLLYRKRDCCQGAVGR